MQGECSYILAPFTYLHLENITPTLGLGIFRYISHPVAQLFLAASSYRVDRVPEACSPPISGRHGAEPKQFSAVTEGHRSKGSDARLREEGKRQTENET